MESIISYCKQNKLVVKNVNIEYSDEVFDYDEKKQDLVLDRIPDITRDCVSFRNNLALFELHAVQ